MSDGTIPRADDAEASVVAAILVWPRALDDLRAAGLAPDDFFDPFLGAAYGAACALGDRREPVDRLTLARELAARRNGAGDDGVTARIGELCGRLPTGANAGHYGRLVLDASARRALMTRAAGIIEAARDAGGDVRDVLDEAERQLLSLTVRGRRTDYRALADLLPAVLDAIEARGRPGARLPGIPSGFADIDALTGGWQPGELIVIAARPSVGKTSFVTGCALHAARAGIPAVMFSLEMGAGAIVERLLASEAKIDSVRMRRGRLDQHDWRRVLAAAGGLDGADFSLDEQPNASLGEIRAKARRWRAAHRDAPSALVVVDYLQLVTTAQQRGQKRYEQVGEISRGLKTLAKELAAPIIAVAQLSRAAEERDGPPRLSDLRESGDIESDGDVVAFLWQPPKGPPNAVRFVVEKQRNGPTGTADLVFHRQHVRFESASARQGDLPA